MKEDLHVLKDFDNDTAIQLIDSAYQFLLDKKSVPLKRLTYNVRIPFSAIYSFMRDTPVKQIARLEQLKLSKEIKYALKQKLSMIYSQNYTKVGLLTNYKQETAKPMMIEKQSREQEVNGKTLLTYAGVQWKVSVVLSTSALNKVLRPEIFLEINTAEGEKLRMFVQVEKFEELRRQIAQLLRYAQQIECIRYLNF